MFSKLIGVWFLSVPLKHTEKLLEICPEQCAARCFPPRKITHG